MFARPVEIRLKGKHVEVEVRGRRVHAYIHEYLRVPPWHGALSSCPSALDYTGYEEIEWELRDVKGNSLQSLEEDLSPGEREALEIEIIHLLLSSEGE